MKIGTLLPETGSLAFLGLPEFAAVDVAIKEINAADGVLNNPVINIRCDSGDDKTDTANQTVDRELAQGAQVLIGAAASGVTKLVIDKITGAARSSSRPPTPPSSPAGLTRTCTSGSPAGGARCNPGRGSAR